MRDIFHFIANLILTYFAYKLIKEVVLEYQQRDHQYKQEIADKHLSIEKTKLKVENRKIINNSINSITKMLSGAELLTQ